MLWLPSVRLHHPILGALISGGLALLGGERRNKAQDSMAEQQMRFQEEMSKTQYQRAVQDLKSAGLNPMLAYSRGGNAAPSGASAEMADTITPAVSSAQAARTIDAALEKTKAETGAAQAQEAATRALALKTAQEARTAMINADVAEQTINSMVAEAIGRGQKGQHDIEYYRWREPFLKDLTQFEYDKERYGVDTSREGARRAKAEATLSELGLSRARAEAGMWEIGGDFLPWLGAIQQGASSAFGMGRFLNSLRAKPGLKPKK